MEEIHDIVTSLFRSTDVITPFMRQGRTTQSWHILHGVMGTESPRDTERLKGAGGLGHRAADIPQSRICCKEQAHPGSREADGANRNAGETPDSIIPGAGRDSGGMTNGYLGPDSPVSDSIRIFKNIRALQLSRQDWQPPQGMCITKKEGIPYMPVISPLPLR